MKLDCEKSVLENALGQVARAISTRSPLPILSHILFEAREDELRLTATDLNVGIQVRLPVRVLEEGATTVSARLMTEIVGRLPGGPLSLATERESMLKVRSGKAEFELATLPAEEFPSLPAPSDAPTMALPQKVLRSMVSCVSVAAADMDEARPVMTGILTLLEGDRVTLVATDGRRLARMTQGLEPDEDRRARVVIPARALQELVRILGDGDDDVLVRVAESQVFFSLPGLSFHCRLLEGSFPDFNRVIPTAFQRCCRLGREALAASLRRMVIVAREKDSPDLVRMEFEVDRVVLSAYTPDLGSAREEIPALLEGEPLVIAFNGRYVLDALAVLESDEVQLDLQDETHSAVLRPLGDSSFDYVCMPVRLREPFLEPVAAGVA